MRREHTYVVCGHLLRWLPERVEEGVTIPTKELPLAVLMSLSEGKVRYFSDRVCHPIDPSEGKEVLSYFNNNFHPGCEIESNSARPWMHWVPGRREAGAIYTGAKVVGHVVGYDPGNGTSRKPELVRWLCCRISIRDVGLRNVRIRVNPPGTIPIQEAFSTGEEFMRAVDVAHQQLEGVSPFGSEVHVVASHKSYRLKSVPSSRPRASMERSKKPEVDKEQIERLIEKYKGA